MYQSPFKNITLMLLCCCEQKEQCYSSDNMPTAILIVSPTLCFSMFLAVSSNITAPFKHPIKLRQKPQEYELYHFCPHEVTTIYFTSLHKHVFALVWSWAKTGMSDWVLKIDPLLLDYILLTIHHQLTTCWPQALVLSALLVSQWGDRKAQCSSLWCS